MGFITRSVQFAALVLLVFSIPLDAHSAVWLLSTTDLLLLFLSLLVLGRTVVNGHFEIHKTSLYIFILLFIIATTRVLALLNGGMQVGQIKYILTGLMIVLIHFNMTQIIQTEEELHRIGLFILLSAVLINGVNIFQGFNLLTLPSDFARFAPPRSVAGIPLPTFRRGTAVFRAFGSYGLWSILGCGVALVSIINQNGTKRGLYLLAVGIILYGNIAVLQSRSVWLGLIMLLGTFFIIASYRFEWHFDWGVRPALILGLLFSPVLIIKSANALINIDPNTVVVRVLQYQVAIEQLTNSPVLGVGYGTILELTGFALHSGFLQVAVYGGITSIVALSIIYLLLLRGYFNIIVLNQASAFDIGILSAVLGVAATGMFYPASTSYIFWLSLTIASVNRDIKKHSDR